MPIILSNIKRIWRYLKSKQRTGLNGLVKFKIWKSSKANRLQVIYLFAPLTLVIMLRVYQIEFGNHLSSAQFLPQISGFFHRYYPGSIQRFLHTVAWEYLWLFTTRNLKTTSNLDCRNSAIMIGIPLITSKFK